MFMKILVEYFTKLISWREQSNLYIYLTAAVILFCFCLRNMVRSVRADKGQFGLAAAHFKS